MCVRVRAARLCSHCLVEASKLSDSQAHALLDGRPIHCNRTTLSAYLSGAPCPLGQRTHGRQASAFEQSRVSEEPLITRTARLCNAHEHMYEHIQYRVWAAHVLGWRWSHACPANGHRLDLLSTQTHDVACHPCRASSKLKDACSCDGLLCMALHVNTWQAASARGPYSAEQLACF